MNKVQEFYNEVPYPNSKADWITYSWIPYPKKRDCKILDVGCGTGEISGYLSLFGKTTGIDFSKSSIKIAKKEYCWIKFFVKDITKSYLKEKFDYIYSIGVLHHIPQIEKALINIKKMSHNKTIFIFAVYNKYAMEYKRKAKQQFKGNGNRDFYDNPYAKEYSQREAENLFTNNGFKILKRPNYPEWIRRLTGRNKLMIFICKNEK